MWKWYSRSASISSVTAENGLRPHANVLNTQSNVDHKLACTQIPCVLVSGAFSRKTSAVATGPSKPLTAHRLSPSLTVDLLGVHMLKLGHEMFNVSCLPMRRTTSDWLHVCWL